MLKQIVSDYHTNFATKICSTLFIVYVFEDTLITSTMPSN